MNSHMFLVHIVTAGVACAAVCFIVFLVFRGPKSGKKGFHWVIPLFGNELHIKRRRTPRFVEDKQEVPVFYIGRTLVSFWPRKTILREARYQD